MFVASLFYRSFNAIFGRVGHSASEAVIVEWPAEGNGDLQTLICVLVARPRRCLTLSNPVPWQNWMVAYLGYTLRMKTLSHGWPVMVHIGLEWRDVCRHRKWIFGILIGTFTCPTQGFHFEWPWVTLSEIFNDMTHRMVCLRQLSFLATEDKQEVKVIWQKAPHGGPIPRLGVTPGGRKLYHWIPGVGFPISVP